MRQQNNLAASGVTAIIDKEKIQPIIVNMRAAYNYATAVRDDVLDKIHPDLSKKVYDLEYQIWKVTKEMHRSKSGEVPYWITSAIGLTRIGAKFVFQNKLA